jgi:hypothetical protein
MGSKESDNLNTIRVKSDKSVVPIAYLLTLNEGTCDLFMHSYPVSGIDQRLLNKQGVRNMNHATTNSKI